MSDNPAIDAIVHTGAGDFEEPTGEFGIMGEDLFIHAGLSHPIEVLQALDARAKELGKDVNITLREQLNEPEITILWQPAEAVDEQ